MCINADKSSCSMFFCNFCYFCWFVAKLEGCCVGRPYFVSDQNGTACSNFKTPELLTASSRQEWWRVDASCFLMGFFSCLQGTTCLTYCKMNLMLEFLEGHTDLKEREGVRENMRKRDDCDEEGWDQSERNEECQEVAINVFILEECFCWSRGYVARDKTLRCHSSIKESMESLLGSLWLDIQRRFCL